MKNLHADLDKVIQGIEEMKDEVSEVLREAGKDIVNKGEELRVFPLFTKADLANRWNINRQDINNRSSRHTDFPKPLTNIVANELKYYPLHEVERYERKRGLTAYD